MAGVHRCSHTLVPAGGDPNAAPPEALRTKPLNEVPDSVTVTVEPPAAEVGAEILVDGLDACNGKTHEASS